MPTTQERLLAACREMSRRVAARPLDPPEGAEPQILEALCRDAAALSQAVRQNPARDVDTLLADAFAIGRAHGLKAARTRDAIEALVTEQSNPRADKALQQLKKAGVLDTFVALVSQA